MALTKEVKQDRIEVQGDYKAIQVREVTIVSENGVEISRSYHRHVIHPSSCRPNEDGTYTHTPTDISEESQEVQDVCNVAWTGDVKKAWQAYEESISQYQSL